MNFLRGVMGGPSAGPQPSGADTIQKLCDRVASSTLLDDRRDAVRALKALSKKYRLEVGIQAMEHLVHVLQTDRFSSTACRIGAVPAEITRAAVPRKRSPSENEAKELPSSPEPLIRPDLSCEGESERY